MSMKTEPIAIIAAITGLIEAVIALMPLFGVGLTIEQQAGLMAVVVAAGSVVSAVWGRSLVTPVANPRDNDGNPLKADQVMAP
jgi:arginine exporter protein ArgO